MKNFTIFVVTVLTLLVSTGYCRAQRDLGIFDAMTGGNYYQETKEDNEASGYYAWAKGRYRPLWLIGQETDFGLGFFVQGEYPFGQSCGAKYKNLQIGGGVNFFLRRPGWFGDLDLGVGRLLRAKVEKGLYESEQRENAFFASVYIGIDARRKMGYSLFPKTALIFSTKIPFSQSSTRKYNGYPLSSLIYNNRRWEVSVSQEIIDFRLKVWRISPGIEGAYGRESDPQRNFSKAGPNLSFYRDRNLFRVSVNYGEQFSGDKDRWYAKVFYWRHLE